MVYYVIPRRFCQRQEPTGTFSCIIALWGYYTTAFWQLEALGEIFDESLEKLSCVFYASVLELGSVVCSTPTLEGVVQSRILLKEEVVDLPNIKSAKKRVKVIETKTAANRMIKSQLKTSIKKAQMSMVEGDPASAAETFRQAQQDIDQAVTRGILHKNTAARRKSRLAARLNALSK